MLGRQKIEFVVRDSVQNFTTIRQRRRRRGFRGGPLEKLWVGGGGEGIFELQEFFSLSLYYFLGLIGVPDFFFV